MPTTIFTPAEFAAFPGDLTDVSRLAVAHGYTNGGNPGANIALRHVGASNEEYAITVDQADDKATIISNLTSATLLSSLVVDVANQTITSNGSDTATFNLTGTPNEIVKLTFQSVLKIDTISVTLDGSGNGSFTVGPYDTGWCTSDIGIDIHCKYVNDIADGCVCTVKVA